MDDKRARFEHRCCSFGRRVQVARWLTCAPGDADDIVAEAVLRAFRGLTLCELRCEGVAAGDCEDCHRRHSNSGNDEPSCRWPEENDAETLAMTATTPDPESASIRRDEQRTLERLIAALPRAPTSDGCAK